MVKTIEPLIEKYPGVWVLGVGPWAERSGMVALGLVVFGLGISIVGVFDPTIVLMVPGYEAMVGFSFLLMWSVYILTMQPKLTVDTLKGQVVFMSSVGKTVRVPFDDVAEFKTEEVTEYFRRCQCSIVLKSSKTIDIYVMQSRFGRCLIQSMATKVGVPHVFKDYGFKN